MDEHLNGSRLLAISGLRNLRDLGGLGAVRTGLCYRSAGLGLLTAEGARELAKLGLRTVIDLRDPLELVQHPDRTHDLEVDLANFPLLPQDGPEDPHGLPLDRVYPLIIDTQGPALVAVLRRLLEPEALPALLHCAIGRDRTGIVTALLLDLLGVPEEQIIADYMLSNEGLDLLDGPREYVDVHGVTRLSHPVEARLLTDLLALVREQHGGTEAYLRTHGLNSAEILDLRATLRE